MDIQKSIKTHTNHYPRLGSLVWISSIQYFIVQIVVAMGWANSYSLAHNTISDLGNTACGVYGQMFVCSPQHGLMNASFIWLGIAQASGAVLFYLKSKKSSGLLIGFSCVAAAGIGTLFVGLFPENTIATLHVIGAGLPFFIGNVGLIVLSIALTISRGMRIYTFVSGAVALLALVLFLTHHYLGIGNGGMERITAYPQTVWLIVYGTFHLWQQYKSQKIN